MVSLDTVSLTKLTETKQNKKIAVLLQLVIR